MDYKELVEMWGEGRKKWQEYSWAVGEVADFILQGFMRRLNISDERIIRLFPESESDEHKIDTTMYSPYACVEFKDNGWSTVGLVILLEKNKQSWPKSNYKFYIKIKRLPEGKWNVVLTEDGKIFTISENFLEEEIDPIFEEFIDVLKYNTINQLDNWLK